MHLLFGTTKLKEQVSYITKSWHISSRAFACLTLIILDGVSQWPTMVSEISQWCLSTSGWSRLNKNRVK